MIHKYTYFITLLIGIAVLFLWIVYGNTTLDIKVIPIEANHTPTVLHGLRIAQISDLHNAEFGKNNARMISALREADADMIVITGDVIDSRRTNVEVALSLAKQAVAIAPTYYVSGNHEARILEEYAKLKQGFEESGVIVLENASVDVWVGEANLSLIGISDPTFHKDSDGEAMEEMVRNYLAKAVPDNANYKILLAHRPEYIREYAKKVDLVFSGHAHGGQFILPFVGGLIAPGQGMFPQYYDGLYTYGRTNMVVSRGIGNSIFPFRVNNRPEIVIAELTAVATKNETR